MQLCFLEGCDQAINITVEKTIPTRGQIGESSCQLRLSFCSVDHAATFERLYPTVTEQMATIARFAANHEARYLTVAQLENAAASLFQVIDMNLGSQGVVIVAREEFEALHRSQRMLASTQRQLNQLRRGRDNGSEKDSHGAS